MRSLRAQLERNIFSSWTLYAIRLGVALFFVPYITSVLGGEQYGVWVIALQSITYLSLLDFGIERALVRCVSRALGLGDVQQVDRIVNTATLFYAGIGLAALAVAWLVAEFGFKFFQISDAALALEGKEAILILGAYLALRFWLFPFANSLGAFQRYDVSNVLQLLEELLRTGLMVWALSRGAGLATLAAIILGTSAARSIVSIVWLRRAFPEIGLHPRAADRSTARELWQYGRTAFGITALWMVIFNSDAILLGLMSSAAAAGIFSPAAQVLNQSRNLINSVATPLTAAIAHLESKGDFAAVRKAYLRGLTYVTYFAVVLMVGVVAFAGPFVHLWLRPEFADSAQVMVILALGSAVFIPQIIGNSILFGVGQHQYLLRVLAAETILKLILAFSLVGRYGPQGMALATTVPQILLYATIYPYYLSRLLRLSVWDTLAQSIRTSFLALVVAGAPSILVRIWLPLTTWTPMIGSILLVGMLSAGCGWFVLAPDDRQRVTNWFLHKSKTPDQN